MERGGRGVQNEGAGRSGLVQEGGMKVPIQGEVKAEKVGSKGMCFRGRWVNGRSIRMGVAVCGRRGVYQKRDRSFVC